jgi:tetratricopeptide (TPR) repeat protein
MASQHREDKGVVDARDWLRGEIERRIESGDFGSAIDKLNRLLGVAEDTETKLYCYENLGILAFRAGQVSEARGAFAEAASLRPQDAGIAYALGHCAAAGNQWWRVLMHSLDAIHRAQDACDEAEFMRLGAAAAHQLGKPEVALSMYLGALDRCADNPWILDSIANFYADQGRFFDALDTQEALIDVLASVFEHPERAPTEQRADVVDRIVRRFMSLLTLDRDDVERRAEHIYRRLRAQIGPVGEPRRHGVAANMGLMSMNLPPALHALIDQLARRDRNFLLLETAQYLWAMARHDGLDQYLAPFALAASIHVVTERKHWRVETPIDDVAEIYGVDADALVAAVRLLVGCFEVDFVDMSASTGHLSIAERHRCDDIQRAILFGVDVSEISSGIAMLGR